MSLSQAALAPPGHSVDQSLHHVGGIDVAYRRLIRKLTKENLWLYILSLLREGPLYGYQVRDSVRERFGFSPSRVTCYAVLLRLRRGGYVAMERTERGGEGPPRKYYKITAKGSETLEKAKSYLRELGQKL